MDIKIRERDTVIILDIEGEIRLSDESLVLHQLVKGKLQEGKRNFLLNFTKVNFVDSTGIGELLACFKSTSDLGGRLKLMKLHPKIRFVFDVCMLFKIFELFDNEEEAVRSFSK